MARQRRFPLRKIGQPPLNAPTFPHGRGGIGYLLRAVTRGPWAPIGNKGLFGPGVGQIKVSRENLPAHWPIRPYPISTQALLISLLNGTLSFKIFVQTSRRSH